VGAHRQRRLAPDHLILFDAEDGQVEAIIEAFALGQMRTAGMSALATDVLAAPDADVLGIIGTGKQALPQVEAAAAVRQLREVRVHGRDDARRMAMAATVESRTGVPAVAVATVEECVSDASIVTLATRATKWFLGAEHLRPGTHLNAIGAIVPSRIELEPALLTRADVVAVDSVDQVRELSNEFRSYFAGDDDRWSRVRPLFELLDGRRPNGSDLTVFKAMGLGAADVLIAVACLCSARSESRGLPLPTAPFRRN
jgi:alanine dehydrogenase